MTGFHAHAKPDELYDEADALEPSHVHIPRPSRQGHGQLITPVGLPQSGADGFPVACAAGGACEY